MARRYLPVYFSYTRRWPVPWHILEVQLAIEELLDTPGGRLILTLPPRCGKSESTLAGIEHALGRGVVGEGDIDRVAYVSHTENLATGYTAAVRDAFGDPRSRTRAIFPEVHLRTRTEAEGEWNFRGYSRHTPNLKGSGIGGGIIGMGFHLIVVDDPIKTPEQAASRTWREKVWNWFQGVPETRQLPGCRFLVVSTRWHHGDLSGRLLRGGGWKHLHLPMVSPLNAERRARWWNLNHAGERDPYAGSEVLVPEFGPGFPGYTPAWCEEQKVRVGSLTWNAQYQGRPTEAEGDLVKRKWLTDRLYDGDAPDMRVIVTWYDCADKPEDDNDWTGFCQGGLAADGTVYLLDFGHGHWDHVDRVKQVRQGRPGWRTDFQSGPPSRPTEPAGVEDTLGGSSVIQEVRRNGGRVVLDRKPSPGESKGVRATYVLPFIEAGGVRAPARHPFLGEFLEEVCSFPRGEHDDVFDAFVWLLIYLTGLTRRVQIVTGAKRDDIVSASPYANL